MDIKKAFEKLRKWFFKNEEESKSSQGEVYFLLIGIDDYQKESKLNYCINDSEYLINIWHDKSNFQVKNKNIYRLYDSFATKKNIVDRLKFFSGSLQSNDQLIIHFSGHGFNDFDSQFFVPFDGYQENIYSCISSLSINSFISELKASNILLIINTWNENQNAKTIDWQKQLKYYNDSKDEIGIFNDLISFLKRGSPERKKEIFWFSRTSVSNKPSANAVLGEWNINDNGLKNEIKATKEQIEDLIEEGNLGKALALMNQIVENNDSTLDSQIKTLAYKIEELKSVNDIANDTLTRQATHEELSKLSTGIVDQIDNNGFFLIHLPTKQSVENFRKKRTIILFTSADPSDQSTLRLNDEYRNIEYELMLSKNRDEYELVTCLASRIADFQRKLLDIRPQIIHFSGHGGNNGICLIRDDSGITNTVENEPLAKLFQLFSKDIKCIFLNSCHSINQSRLISKCIDNVICMNNSVNDKTAIHFATSFYAALYSGENIKFSFDFAKNSIDLHKLSGSEIPQLLERNSSN